MISLIVANFFCNDYRCTKNKEMTHDLPFSMYKKLACILYFKLPAPGHGRALVTNKIQTTVQNFRHCQIFT